MKRLFKLILCSACAPLALPAVPAWAVPSVTPIPEPVAHGSVITVVGADFSNDGGEVPAAWDDFERCSRGSSATECEDLPSTESSQGTHWLDPAGGGWSNITSYHDAAPAFDSAERYGQGQLSIYTDFRTQGGTSATKAVLPPFSKIYVSFMLRYHNTLYDDECTACAGGPPCSAECPGPNYKGLRIIDGMGSDGLHGGGAQWAHQNQTIAGSRVSVDSCVDGLDNLWSTYFAPHPEDQWARAEYYIELHDSAAVNRHWRDGELLLDEPRPNIDTGCPAVYREVLLPFYSRDPRWSLGGEHWYDDVYISHSQARVEVCAGSTWAARAKCEIQLPTSWSDTRIEATINQGAFASGSQQYLYVVDAAGTANPDGVPLSFGGSGQPVDGGDSGSPDGPAGGEAAPADSGSENCGCRIPGDSHRSGPAMLFLVGPLLFAAQRKRARTIGERNRTQR